MLLVLGGITLYKTFALYEEKKEFNVLQGRIPDFREKYKESIENVMFSILSFCVDNKPGSLQFSSFPRLH